jgi:hypothetical protein
MSERKLDPMGIISIILGVAGVICSFVFVALFLRPILLAETDAARECAMIAPYMIPTFAVIGIIGGILWLLAGIGWFEKREWAYALSIGAVVINLFANFWPNIPTMESKTMTPGPWFFLWIPNLLIFFYLTVKKGQESWAKSILGLIIGMAYILMFINGIAATTRMVNRIYDVDLSILGTSPWAVVVNGDLNPAFMYMICLPLCMIASFLLGAAVVGLFLSKRKDLVRIVALAGVFMGITGGYPLAIYSMITTGVAVSMFIMGPVVSTIAGLLLLPNKVWEKAIK